jgi:hypothetical protein
MNVYLKNLKKLFLQHFGTFSSVDQEEILFSLDLLRASNRFYQYSAAGGIAEFFYRPLDIRQKYFSKTIERAYRKAKKRKAILLCLVGSSHIYSDHKYKCEARYFAEHYPLTKGKVATINLVPLYSDIREVEGADVERHNGIDSIVKALMTRDSPFLA